MRPAEIMINDCVIAAAVSCARTTALRSRYRYGLRDARLESAAIAMKCVRKALRLGIKHMHRRYAEEIIYGGRGRGRARNLEEGKERL